MKQHLIILTLIVSFAIYHNIYSQDSSSGNNNDTNVLFDEYSSLYRDSIRLEIPKDHYKRESEFIYTKSLHEHRQRVFDFQYTSSIIIFIMVLIIVFTGMIFSGIHFWITLKKPWSYGSRKEDTTFIEANMKGIKFQSSLIGIIILFISLLFFALYLIYVYPIKVL